jgi:hypothetical protein
MSQPPLVEVMDLALAITGPPYDLEAAQGLCSLLEQILAARLESESSWPPYDWLDGFLATTLERDDARLTIRGGIWVNAVRPEPCEIELRLHKPRAATLRFMDALGPSEARELGRLEFPALRTWRYVYDLDVPVTG